MRRLIVGALDLAVFCLLSGCILMGRPVEKEDDTDTIPDAGSQLVIPPECDGVLTFPDANLESAIRRAISKPTGDIMFEDVSGLTVLSSRSSNISELTGIDCLTDLTTIYLDSNQISDIGPLSGLTNLPELGLRNNRISDLSPLSGLTNLKKLDLNNNQITDINALSGLTNLWGLWLNNNQIIDLSPLVANPGIGSGDTVQVTGNLLACVEQEENRLALVRRGVNLTYDCIETDAGADSGP